MKTQNIFLFLFALILSPSAFAHCPSQYKPEKVCLMFEAGMLYIYDEKMEHNGPYKDLEKAEVTAIRSMKGDPLQFKKLARGIFKLSSPESKGVVVEFTLNKTKKDVKVLHE